MDKLRWKFTIEEFPIVGNISEPTQEAFDRIGSQIAQAWKSGGEYRADSILNDSIHRSFFLCVIGELIRQGHIIDKGKEH